MRWAGRFFRGSFWLLGLCLSGFFSVSAYADYMTGWAFSSSGVFTTPDSACQWWCGTRYSPSKSVVGCTVSAYGAGWTSVSASCSGGGGNTALPVIVYGSSCPAPNVVDPVTKVCGPPPPCPSAGTSAIPSGKVGYGESALGTNPLLGVLCGENACEIRIEAATAIPIGGGQQGVYISQASYTGNRLTGSCPLIVVANSPTDSSLTHPVDAVTPQASGGGAPTSAKDCPRGSAFGQVNGVNVCLPGGSVQSAPTGGSSQNNNGVTTESTTTKTKVVNDDGTVTTKTTTTTTSGGSSSTTTTTQKGSGEGGIDLYGGNDGSEGVDLGPAPNAESGDVGWTGPTAGSAPSRTFAVGSYFGGAGGCLADKSVSVMGVQVGIPLSALCPYLDVVYNIVSVMGVFASLRILVMG